MKSEFSSSQSPAFELKGSVLTVMVLYIKDVDSRHLVPQMHEKIGPAKSFFNNAPILIDIKAVSAKQQKSLDIQLIADTLRRLALVPIGVRGSVRGELKEKILKAGLGVLPEVRNDRPATGPTDIVDSEHVEPAIADLEDPALEELDEPNRRLSNDSGETKVVSMPVRSGQQIVAPGGDLIILAPVNPGAELLAAGSIHVYGALRGRALAGINGNTKARIFSLQCNPELIAIAGVYAVNEAIRRSLINNCVMASLIEGNLRFENMGTFTPNS